MTESILNVDNVEGTRVTFTVDNGSNSPQVTTASDHAQITRIELDKVHDFVGSDIQLNGIVNFNQWVGVADGTTIMGRDERDTLRSNLDTANFAELVL